jgi:hypothetical protein
VTKLIMVALTNPAPDREAEFNDWYDNTHIPQIRAAVPGVGDVHRYRTADTQAGHRYLALYEIEADGPGPVLGALGAGVESGAVQMTDAMDTAKNPPVTVVYEAC